MLLFRMEYAERAADPPEKLDALDRIILIRVKVEWAKKHLQNLATDVLAATYTTILTPDPDTGVPPHPIALLHPNDFPKVPTFSVDVITSAGDIVHNLRSALDHLAQQLVAVGVTKRPPKPPLTAEQIRRIGFPIAETSKKYKAEKRAKVKGMLPEARKAIDRLKPYKGGNDALWRIHELDNIDKHRSLFTVAPHFLFTAQWLEGCYMLKTDKPHFTGIETQVEKDIQLEIKEALSQPQVSKANALLPSLHQLVKFVDDLILSFKPLLE
jgi:hypothetical protein